jgi:hypothetical protein
MTRIQDLHISFGRWTVIAAFLLVALSASAVQVVAQSAGEGSSAAAVVDQAPTDADMADTEQAQATDAAPVAPKPTVAPFQFGPTGC